MTRVFFLFVACALGLAVSAQAATVKPSSYDMRNGDSGTFSYWDDSYTGQGNTGRDGARLRGGVGDLVDGIVATENWRSVEGPNGGPFVGWNRGTHHIDFWFEQSHVFSSIVFHFDSYGGGGGVKAPRRVTINGDRQDVLAPGADPFAFVFDATDLAATNLLSVKVQRGRFSDWIFLSEVTFNTDVPEVPLPASSLMLFGALAGLGWLVRKKRHS
jgi:hypothetical protein